MILRSSRYIFSLRWSKSHVRQVEFRSDDVARQILVARKVESAAAWPPKVMVAVVSVGVPSAEAASGEPHREQNFALSAFWLPHCEQ